MNHSLKETNNVKKDRSYSLSLWILLIGLSIAIVSILIRYNMGELDFANFMLAQITFLFVRDLYPTVNGAEEWRKMLETASKGTKNIVC